MLPEGEIKPRESSVALERAKPPPTIQFYFFCILSSLSPPSPHLPSFSYTYPHQI